jgi:hypothetical protein
MACSGTTFFSFRVDRCDGNGTLANRFPALLKLNIKTDISRLVRACLWLHAALEPDYSTSLLVVKVVRMFTENNTNGNVVFRVFWRKVRFHCADPWRDLVTAILTEL